MSSRVTIKELLKGVEVEWKSLWEVTIWDKKFNAVENFKQPKIIKYHYLLSKEIKSLVTEGGNVKLLTTNLSNLYTTEELAGDIISQGEIVAIPWGGNPIVQYYNGKFLTSDNRIATSNDTKLLNNKYLYYYLLNNIDLISSLYRGSGIKHPSMADVLDIKIPIPPLKIQSEIVRVLDNFTELTA
ncbi:MAG: restriction endonuclease subunit S, partial [Epsilonproteobacteria bacterium]|nr:restriction endonuclease subunit S [Campylobacterota bacterium]